MREKLLGICSDIACDLIRKNLKPSKQQITEELNKRGIEDEIDLFWMIPHVQYKFKSYAGGATQWELQKM